MKDLVNQNKKWMGVNKTSAGFKVLDYGTGTGFLSMVRHPVRSAS